ncbi:hypothetical protein ABZV85_30585 [Streptomyces griseus]
MEMLDFDLAAAVAEFAGKKFGKTACAVPASRTADGDVVGSGGEVGVVGEVGEEFAGAGVLRTTSWTRGWKPSRSRMSRAAAGSRSRSRTSSIRSAAGGTGWPSGPVGRCR